MLTFFSDVDDSEQPYALYLPKNFDPARKYPLVMMLHGGGSNHRLALRRVFGRSNADGESDAEATRYFPSRPDVDYIVAAPLARGSIAYQGIAERDVLAVLADVKKRFPIDENRTYLTGLSLGGGGTLWIGLTHPDIWAAIAPVCPDPAPGIFELASNALNYPVHFFQGGADPVVNPAGTREWAKRMQELGTKTEYTEFPGVGHNAWENAYKDEQIFAWFSQFTRNQHPDRVRYVSSDYDHAHAWWATLDRLTPGTFATLDAQFTGPNRIEVKTSELGAFTLELAGHPKFASGQAIAVTIEGKTFTATTSGSLSFNKTDAGWVAGKFEAPAMSKRSGAQGPMVEAMARRLTYVYGTGGNPLAAELERAAHRRPMPRIIRETRYCC